jgi:hypothetical protein
LLFSMRSVIKDGVSQDCAVAVVGIAGDRQTAIEREVAGSIVVSHLGDSRQGGSKTDTTYAHSFAAAQSREASLWTSCIQYGD